MQSRIVKVVLSTLAVVAALVAIPVADDDGDGPIAHVLLLSIDGLHAVDLERYVADNPLSTLAQLSARGRTYTNASASKPSDSFPGLLTMVTGGTPLSTGVYYDDGWDRSLAPAANPTPVPPAPCVPGVLGPGAHVQWKQNLDFLPFSFITTIDPSRLPLDPMSTPSPCKEVYPHQFPRVNNVFELVKAAGGRTAWSDKHPAYEFLMGPSGTGIDDLYTPEITTAPPTTTNSFALTMAYDHMKVLAILNEINGFDHTGTTPAPTPALFGMNFQAVSVGQKLKAELATAPDPLLVGGYVKNTDGTLSFSTGLKATLDYTDRSIGEMVDALRDHGLLDSTLIIMSAKHGNSPMDPTTLVRVNPTVIQTIVNSVAPGLLAQSSADTGPLIWLKNQAQTAAAVDALHLNRAALNLLPDDIATERDEAILSGADVAAFFGVPPDDSRVPDILLLPIPGTLYSLTPSKIADHGSFNDDDVHVALLVSNPSLPRKTIDDPVETRQIACTILKALEMDCDGLMSQLVEPSKFLPHSSHPNDD